VIVSDDESFKGYSYQSSNLTSVETKGAYNKYVDIGPKFINQLY